jgi:hypothetical protein
LVVVELNEEGIELGTGNQVIILVYVTISGNDTFRGGSDEQLLALLTPPVNHGNVRRVAC